MTPEFMRDHYQSILGLPVVGIDKGIGSFLNVFFGIDRRYRLWIYMCDWQINGSDDISILESDTISDSNVSMLSAIIGNKLVDVKENNRKTEVRLNFEREYNIFLDDASDIYGAKSDMMIFFDDDKFVSAYVSSVGISTEPDSLS